MMLYIISNIFAIFFATIALSIAFWAFAVLILELR